MVGRHLVRAERLLAGKEFAAALAEIGAIVDLQENRDLELPDEFNFKYAQAAIAAGLIGDVIDALNDYLLAAGRSGELYRQALELLDRAAAASAEFNGDDPTAFAWFDG